MSFHFEQRVPNELDDVLIYSKSDRAIESDNEISSHDEEVSEMRKYCLNDRYQQKDEIIDKKCSKLHETYVLPSNVIKMDAIGNIANKDICIKSSEVVLKDNSSIMDIIPHENATMGRREVLVEPVSTGYTVDANVRNTSLHEFKSNKCESYILNKVSYNDNTHCVFEGKDKDLNSCELSTESPATSKNITGEKMYIEAKDCADVGFDCVYDDNCLADEILKVSVETESLPFLDQLCDNELDDVNTRMNVPLSKIPKFEMLLQDIPGKGGKLSLDSGENDDTTSMIDLLKDLRNELINTDDMDDFGLTLLFEDTQQKQRFTRGKSKAAQKRKKQLQKLQRFATSQKSDKRKRMFAQSFQELQSSQTVFDEHDVDSSITCPVCLEMYHLPSVCNPCGHVFCDPCLRRLTSQGSERIPCPLCRTVITSCGLNTDFDEYLLLTHLDIYTARAKSESHSKYRHYKLPYTAPVPLGKRLMRQLIGSRNNQSYTGWMSHEWFKFLLGCTAGMCLSLLIMVFNRVKSVRDARDVNIVFLSILIGASVTFLIFKFIKI